MPSKDADLPPNAVLRPGNELVADVITTGAVTVPVLGLG
jgi:hypothetical protein